MSYQVPSKFLVPTPATRMKKKTSNAITRGKRQYMYFTPNALFILLTSPVTGSLKSLVSPHNADYTRRRAEASIFSEMPHRGGIID